MRHPAAEGGSTKKIKIRNMLSSDRSAVEAKIEVHVQNLADLAMQKCHDFQNYSASDIALAVIICARSLAGILNDFSHCQVLLEEYQFRDWTG